MATIKTQSHVQDITPAQEPRVSVHKRVAYSVRARDSRARVNDTKGLELVQPLEKNQYIF